VWHLYLGKVRLCQVFRCGSCSRLTRRSRDSEVAGGEIRRVHVGLGLGFVEMTDTLVYASVFIQFDHGMIIGIERLMDIRLISQSVD
jgi:hypothetical protein